MCKKKVYVYATDSDTTIDINNDDYYENFDDSVDYSENLNRVLDESNTVLTESDNGDVHLTTITCDTLSIDPISIDLSFSESSLEYELTTSFNFGEITTATYLGGEGHNIFIDRDDGLYSAYNNGDDTLFTRNFADYIYNTPSKFIVGYVILE